MDVKYTGLIDVRVMGYPTLKPGSRIDYATAEGMRLVVHGVIMASNFQFVPIESEPIQIEPIEPELVQIEPKSIPEPIPLRGRLAKRAWELKSSPESAPEDPVETIPSASTTQEVTE